jgi:hypothetical protein
VISSRQVELEGCFKTCGTVRFICCRGIAGSLMTTILAKSLE